MKKKGYIFTLDVIIAIVILVIGTTIYFYNFYLQDKPIFFTEQISEDVVGVMSFTRLNDLCFNPGESSCQCINYPRLEQLVCRDTLQDPDGTILTLISEIIATNSASGDDVKELIHEIFVTKKVIDEKRFGFAILYTEIGSNIPLELYNTETYP